MPREPTIALLVLPLVLASPAAARAVPGEAPARLFLNFDGATVEQGPEGDVVRATSTLCGAEVPPFDHRRFGADRAEVTERMRRAVAEHFEGLALEVVTRKPATPGYHMALVGGSPGVCGRGDGIGGLGPLDCDNQHGGDLFFVFSVPITAIEALALVTAHEMGHALGLPHTTEPCDAMSNAWCDQPKRFLDQDMDVAPDHLGRCGLRQVNSYALLLQVLGSAHREDMEPGGCEIGDGAFCDPLWLFYLLVFCRSRVEQAE
jgi:hypothetical protein